MAREFILKTSVWVRVYSEQLILILSMRKIDWRHPVCLWCHWEAWQYHRSIDKWKGYKLRKRYEDTKKVLSYKKGTKLRKRYEVTEKIRKRYEVTKKYEATKKVPSYEKGTKLRKSYEDTNMVRSSGKRYEVTKKVRICYEIRYEMPCLWSSQVTR
jgi:hypothetical protein